MALLKQARALAEKAEGSTLSAEEHTKIQRLRDRAAGLLWEKKQKQKDVERAKNHPPTHHTPAAWGASPGQPLHQFPRAVHTTLLQLNVSRDLADRLTRGADEEDPQPGRWTWGGQGWRGSDSWHGWHGWQGRQG